MVPHYSSIFLDSPTVSSEELVAVDDDNERTSKIMADNNIFRKYKSCETSEKKKCPFDLRTEKWNKASKKSAGTLKKGISTRYVHRGV
ncbi:hypothetical protein TNCV_3444631 [Trichonephila clavipes]|nr:hypothetical protein TNCV_3444631 [Trichonephila clavipes]